MCLPAGRSSVRDTKNFLPDTTAGPPQLLACLHAAVASTLAADALARLVSQSSASMPDDTLSSHAATYTYPFVHTPLACRKSYMCSRWPPTGLITGQLLPFFLRMSEELPISYNIERNAVGGAGEVTRDPSCSLTLACLCNFCDT